MRSFLYAINKYILGMRSLMKLEHDYVTAEEYYADRKKYGIQAMFKDMYGNMIFTKSEEERRICEWLSLHDIQFTYEEAYEYPTSSDLYRQYRPDFSIHYINEDGEKDRLYFEHFAIDKNGNVPLWFGTDYNNSEQDDINIVNRWKIANQVYKDGIDWKLKLHQAKETKLIYTTSAMFHDKSVWNHLKQQLILHGIHVKSLNQEELYDRLVQRDKGLERSIFKLIEQFTTLQKTNLITVEELIKKAKENKDTRSEFIISEIMNPLITYYNKELIKKQYIDFTDAIHQATQLCKEGRWVDYDYILVDEFQDISKDRYLFLESLRKNTSKCFTKLFCVGDDWQSIYRFSGSDMTLFYDFEKYFGYTKHCKIETTYRFHNPLIRISSDFIQTNPNQVQKSIKDFFIKSQEYKKMEKRYYTECTKHSSEHDDMNSSLEGISVEKHKPQDDIAKILKDELDKMTPKTDIKLYEYASDDDEKKQVETLIKGIPLNESVLVVARYNYDSKSLGFKFTPQDADKKVIWLTLSGRKVRFMSVHGSKGLEADHVILINCNRGINGFPSLIEDDPVLTFVLSDKDAFENAEERRVFYVAITRAKKRTHIFYCDKTPSCFVDEIKGTDTHYINKYIPCPTCGNGHIFPIKEGTNRLYGDWVALTCTNKTGGCPYFKLMSKSEYIEMCNDFNNKNAISPVQEYSKKMSSMIKECFKSVELKEKINRYAQSNYGSSINRKP
jgi:DNA helicase-4